MIDLPRQCGKDVYEDALAKTVHFLSTQPYVRAIYQVGHVAHPGISDLDLLVVVEDTSASETDPLDQLTADERYVFTHSCFVAPVSLIGSLGRYVLLGAYRRLYGPEWAWAASPDTHRALEVQTALEFLAKNVLDLYVQLTYRALKVRVFLQHVKGVMIDLDLIGGATDESKDLVGSAFTLIDEWFARSDSEHRLARLAPELLPVLRDALADATLKHALNAPSGGSVPFAANIRLEPASTVDIARRGLRIPRLPGLKDRRAFNAQHRFNRFRMRIPMTPATVGSYHARRFDVLREAKVFATKRFPAYSAPIPPLFYRAL